MRISPIACLTLCLSISACGGSGWHPSSPDDRAAPPSATAESSDETLARFREKDPSLERFLDQAYGVAVFRTVGKGAAGLGGAYGEGYVYERGALVGSSSLTQLTVGFALGGQSYSEIIFFEDKAALDHFKSGNFELGAQASAVAVTAGASSDAAYSDGVAIFTLTKGGLMYEAAVSGQKFSYSAL